VAQNKACFGRDNNGDVCSRDQVAWRPDACGRRRALVAGATEPFGRGRRPISRHYKNHRIIY
jgi:hypothetical protein